MDETFTATYASGRTRTFTAPNMANALAIAQEWTQPGDERVRIDGELGSIYRVPGGRWAFEVVTDQAAR